MCGYLVMSAGIDILKFESLEKRELDNYLLDLLNQGFRDSSFVEVAATRSSTWDPVHLEYAIRLLVEVGSPSAYREIAKHLAHPASYVRLGAMNAIRELKAIDEQIMERVAAAILNPVQPDDAKYLRPVLERAENAEAEAISKRCGSQRASSGTLSRLCRRLGFAAKERQTR
jgi:hypothetical protein